MGASQVLKAPTYYTTFAPNDTVPDPYCCNQYKTWKFIALKLLLKTFKKLADARKSRFAPNHGRNFIVKCGGQLGEKPI